MLSGLRNGLVSDCMKLFGFLLEQANEKDLGANTHEGDTLEQVKTILSKAVNFDHGHCTTGE